VPRRPILFVVLICSWLCMAVARAAATPAADLADRVEHAQDALIESYDDPLVAFDRTLLSLPAEALTQLDPAARRVLDGPVDANGSLAFGRFRARVQQAAVLEMAAAVRDGRVADAQAWRAILDLPGGVSANEGGVLLTNLPAGGPQRADAARVLVREAITWQTARVRQLLAAAGAAADHPQVPLPGRLAEQLGEAATLAAVPGPLRSEAGLAGPPLLDPERLQVQVADVLARPWAETAAPLAALRREVETHLPSLLSDAERDRREHLLLKLVSIIPTEYRGGVDADRHVTVTLEYREAVSFTAQARQYADELTPFWLVSDKLRVPLQTLESSLDEADQDIKAKVPPDELAAVLKRAQQTLQDDFHISSRRGGTTADIVDEVMLETRSLLNQSLAAATAGKWGEAESLRLEAYTTYDPDLEARLMPRDPQLATDIEHLILDGLDKPGVKALLDRHVTGDELEGAYTRVESALDRAAALLKSGVSPTAAAFNAGSIVLREGLEGLLVIVAILAGLRGEENRRKRHFIWYGVLLSMVATVVTVVLSETVITRLRSYAEVIEAVTSVLAIGVLMLITNWLFQQVYWKQWVTSLKSQASGDGAWRLITVGFLIGYREGFETVLFIQSLVMDAGGGPVMLGVGAGLVALVALGVAAQVGGLKLPYFQLLLLTAGMIGMVLVTFVGTGVRAMQTVGWLPVHKLANASWPAWVGSWLGVYNSAETLGGQLLAIAIVIGTWRWSRWRSKRAVERRRATFAGRAAGAAVVAPNAGAIVAAGR
jgi:high-affinity iron transporter